MKNKLLTTLILIASTVAVFPARAADNAHNNGVEKKDQTKSIGTNTTKNKPDSFFFEEDWIVVPATPSLNLDVVTFNKGSSALTEAAKTKLRKAITNLKNTGPVKEAYVAVYADTLRAGTKDLSDKDLKLVRQRAKALRSYLENDFGIDAVTFNMAARPGWWARLWNTEKAQVTEANNGSRNWIADLLRANNEPSTATVVLTTRSSDKQAR